MQTDLTHHQVMRLQKSESYDRAVDELNRFFSKVSEIAAQLENDEWGNAHDVLKATIAETGKVVARVNYELS